MALSCRTKASLRADESGYIIATTALLLIPLMIFAAFAVDVGAWYAEADEAQRAADAAALAGVVMMPDFGQATAAAENAARINGFDSADPDVTIVTERRGSQGFFVRIESKGETYFGKVVLDEIDIARYAAAEYITPVPLGNPGSSLGAGLDTPPIAGDPAERMVLALNSYCQGYNNGDPFGAGFLGTNTCSGTVNNRYPTNPDDRGYYFVLDFSGPDDQNNPVTGDWDLQIWEPGLCGQLSEGNTTTGAALETTLWAGDNTLLTDDDNLVDSNRWPNAVNGSTGPYEWPRDTCGGTPPRSPWITAYEIDADLHQGRWLLRTRTLQRSTENSLNSFGLRLVPHGGGAVCGSIAPSSTCPQVYADTWLPIFIPRWINDANNNRVTTFATAQTATFYLADIPEVHQNKVLEVKLFDPGEGMDNMQILAPDGTRYPFERATLNPNAVAPSGFVDNNNRCTPPSAAFADPDTMLGSFYECLDVTGSVYNGVEVIIRVPIPIDYACPESGGVKNCWWRVRYERDPSSPLPLQDRTTWNVRVIGDPVRLTE